MRRSLSDAVFDRIQRAIKSGAYGADERLPTEHALATDENGEALHGLLTLARFARAQVSVRDSDLAVRLDDLGRATGWRRRGHASVRERGLVGPTTTAAIAEVKDNDNTRQT